MNIPPRGKSKNGRLGRLARALSITVALCATVTGCRLELAADAGSLVPSVNEVQTLLDQDRVRQALERADLLARQYPGPQTDLVYGWALWRNGDVRGAESRFRRAAEAGLDNGYVGLAAVRAIDADWPAVIELASGRSSGTAHALLASAAWVGGQGETAARELRAWNQVEAGTARGRAAGAMAAAVARLQGMTQQWDGDAVVLPIRELAGGGWAVEARIEGQPALLRIDLTFRQSIISERLAAAAGIMVDGSDDVASRTASSRWPSMLSARQAALAHIEFGAVAVRNVVVAVGELPDGVDGVLGAELLSAARWSVSPVRAEMVLSPPGRASAADALGRSFEGRTIAWLSARVLREGLGAQMLLFPRVENTVVAAGLDLGGTSRLDSDLLPAVPGSGTALAQLTLGGWRGDVPWRPASLAGWAIDGGVAPTVVIGANLLDAWSLHWYPATKQLRVDAPSSSGRQP